MSWGQVQAESVSVREGMDRAYAEMDKGRAMQADAEEAHAEAERHRHLAEAALAQVPPSAPIRSQRMPRTHGLAQPSVSTQPSVAPSPLSAECP